MPQNWGLFGSHGAKGSILLKKRGVTTESAKKGWPYLKYVWEKSSFAREITKPGFPFVMAVQKWNFRGREDSNTTLTTLTLLT